MRHCSSFQPVCAAMLDAVCFRAGVGCGLDLRLGPDSLGFAKGKIEDKEARMMSSSEVFRPQVMFVARLVVASPYDGNLAMIGVRACRCLELRLQPCCPRELLLVFDPGVSQRSSSCVQNVGDDGGFCSSCSCKRHCRVCVVRHTGVCCPVLLHSCKYSSCM